MHVLAQRLGLVREIDEHLELLKVTGYTGSPASETVAAINKDATRKATLLIVVLMILSKWHGFQLFL